jgi:hypothetical protein
MSAQILSPTTKSPTRPLTVECRVCERHSCDLQTSCQPVAARSDNDLSWPATVRDISVKGVGLVLRRRFEPGTGLAIEVPATATHPGDTLLGKVVHATALAGGNWLLGCQFVSELGDDELTGLLRLAQSQKTMLKHDRQAPITERTTVLAKPKANPILISGITLEGTTAKGRVGRVPVRRLYLSGKWPLAKGAVLRVRVTNRDNDLPPVRLKVTSCTFDGKRWKVSYTFADPAPPAMMHLLGHVVSGEWQL